MPYLNIQNSAIVVSLNIETLASDVILDQLGPVLDSNRFIILRLEDFPFTTLVMGDIINVYNYFKTRWDDRIHRMIIVSPNDSVKKIFEMAKIADELPVYSSVDEALRNLPASA